MGTFWVYTEVGSPLSPWGLVGVSWSGLPLNRVDSHHACLLRDLDESGSPQEGFEARLGRHMFDAALRECAEVTWPKCPVRNAPKARLAPDSS